MPERRKKKMVREAESALANELLRAVEAERLEIQPPETESDEGYEQAITDVLTAIRAECARLHGRNKFARGPCGGMVQEQKTAIQRNAPPAERP